MKAENLVLYIGPMFCEKSKHLVIEHRQSVKAGEEVVAFKPSADSGRYGSGAHIQSKEPEYRAPAILIDHQNPRSMIEHLKQVGLVAKVIIDEGSFYPAQELITVVSELTDQGIRVVVGGLTHFSTREPWGAMLELSRLEGVSVNQLYSRCDGDGGNCSEGAIWSYEKVAKEDSLTVGSDGLYGACCDKHYRALHQGEIWQG